MGGVWAYLIRTARFLRRVYASPIYILLISACLFQKILIDGIMPLTIASSDPENSKVVPRSFRSMLDFTKRSESEFGFVFA